MCLIALKWVCFIVNSQLGLYSFVCGCSTSVAHHAPGRAPMAITPRCGISNLRCRSPKGPSSCSHVSLTCCVVCLKAFYYMCQGLSTASHRVCCVVKQPVGVLCAIVCVCGIAFCIAWCCVVFSKLFRFFFSKLIVDVALALLVVVHGRVSTVRQTADACSFCPL